MNITNEAGLQNALAALRLRTATRQAERFDRYAQRAFGRGRIESANVYLCLAQRYRVQVLRLLEQQTPEPGDFSSAGMVRYFEHARASRLARAAVGA